jgi:hypothetical protein
MELNPSQNGKTKPRINWLHALLILLQVASIAADQVWRFLYLPKSLLATAASVATAAAFLVLAGLTIRHVWALYVRAGFSFLAIGNAVQYFIGQPSDKPHSSGDLSLWAGGLVLNLIIGVLCLVVAKQLSQMAASTAADPSSPPNPLKGA